MQLKFTLLAAALSASVAADFVVVTIPKPQIDILTCALRPLHPQLPFLL
tara:strand:+ start:36165 stop:36311 length:147 start_codon:yes stop_codon:yes gene_type:complete